MWGDDPARRCNRPLAQNFDRAQHLRTQVLRIHKRQALGLNGRQPVGDLWLRKNLGRIKDRFAQDVPAHGACLIKVGKPRDMD